MTSWFKKHFIPHVDNDHRPHFLRQTNIHNFLIMVLFLEVFTFITPTLLHINMTGGMATVLPSILTNLTNDERQAQKLNTLVVNPILTKAAEMKANDMATKGYFAHTSPEGITPWYWLSLVDYDYQYAGENLAINFTDSKDVTEAWMNSPTHKANIVKGNYTEVGTGIATGIYEGKETIFVAQIYANPIKNEVKPIERPIEEIKVTADTENVSIDENIKEETVNVLGAESVLQVQVDTKPTLLQRFVASPRNNSNIILFTLLGIVLISLLLNILIKIKHHHPDLVSNGLMTLIIITAILIGNYYLSHNNMVVAQSLDYSIENK